LSLQLSAIIRLSDRDLLRRFVQGTDEVAFWEIVRRHHGFVIWVCRWVIGNDADVDDALHSTFIALARRPRQVRNTVSLSSWLYSVAWLTLVRQRRKHPVGSLNQHPQNEEADALDRIGAGLSGVG